MFKLDTCHFSFFHDWQMVDRNVLQRREQALRVRQTSFEASVGERAGWIIVNSPGAGGSFVNFTTILPSLDDLRVSMERGKRSMIYRDTVESINDQKD
jgi:hypothetical protein